MICPPGIVTADERCHEWCTLARRVNRLAVSRYLRNANGELKETFDALRDAVDRGYLGQDQVVPLQRLSRRASKAATELIKYLRTAKPPHETPPPRRNQQNR